MAELTKEQIAATKAAAKKHTKPDGSLNCVEVAKELNITESSARRRLVNLGIRGKASPSINPVTLSEAEIEKTKKAARKYTQPDGTLNVADVARELGIAPSTARGRLNKLGLRGLPPTRQDATSGMSRLEVRDVSFWRERAKKFEKELADLDHVIAELSGVRDIPIKIPRWLTSEAKGKTGKSVVSLLLSDVHAGEVIDAEEILGINEFNPDICRRRLRRYFEASCIIGQRWAADTSCQGAILALAGDLISGDIHEELRITNTLTSHEQVALVVEEVSAGIKVLKEAFGYVHVIGVPGNHGRTTPKPTSKLYSRLSYDILICQIIASFFRDDPKVTFQYGKAKDQITPVFGRMIYTTHGDKIGTRGGMGFAGPDLPIVRGAKKIHAQQSSIGRDCDLLQFGHYHHTSQPGNIFANGSVPGYSEYADDLRAVVEPPQQWTYLLHSKWWVRERMPVQLEDPRKAKGVGLSIF